MARVGVVLGAVILAGIGVACAIHSLLPKAEAAPFGSPVAAAAGATPILVELFTSEGCSSCPPADSVAARLEHSQPVAGARVIVLAHHVDYWNQLGWPDPWSSSAASARQRAYAPLKSGSYTPQAVIDGRAEMVGSRSGAIENAIASAAKEDHAKLELEVAPVASDKNAFEVTVKPGALPTGSAADTELLLAVVQDRGRVAVSRGENAGQTLDHTGIARSITTVTAGAKTRVTVPTAIDAPNGTTFSVIAFVQERASRKILGSSAAGLTR